MNAINNGYICYYRCKTLEVYAATTYDAQKIAAAKFKAKKQYEVSVYLAEKNGNTVTHTITD